MGQLKGNTAAFEIDEITVDTQRCLNARHFKQECRHCALGCPLNAITLTNGTPTIIRESCLNCGICFQLCPAEVFFSPYWSERNLTEAFLQASKAFVLVCSQNDAISSETSSFFKIGICLAGLSPGALVELANHNLCVLDLSNCSECPFGSAQQLIVHHVEYANNILRYWDANQNIKISIEPIALEGAVKQQKKYSSAENKNRNKAKIKWKNISANFIAQRAKLFSMSGSPMAESPLPFRLPKKHIPSWKSNLKQFWETHPQDDNPPRKSSLWPILRIDGEKCLACGACMQFCPTGAIIHSFKEDVFETSYCAGICLDCDICALSCPNKALRHSTDYLEDPFKPRIIFSKKALPCLVCGAPVVGSSKEQICTWCSSEPNTQSIFGDFKKKMDF